MWRNSHNGGGLIGCLVQVRLIWCNLLLGLVVWQLGAASGTEFIVVARHLVAHGAGLLATGFGQGVADGVDLRLLLVGLLQQVVDGFLGVQHSAVLGFLSVGQRARRRACR